MTWTRAAYDTRYAGLIEQKHALHRHGAASIAKGCRADMAALPYCDRSPGRPYLAVLNT